MAKEGEIIVVEPGSGDDIRLEGYINPLLISNKSGNRIALKATTESGKVWLIIEGIVK